MKAEITQVQIGQMSIEGLMTEDTQFLVAVPQICEMFQFPIKHASRDIKALLGKGFQFPKVRT